MPTCFSVNGGLTQNSYSRREALDLRFVEPLDCFHLVFTTKFGKKIQGMIHEMVHSLLWNMYAL